MDGLRLWLYRPGAYEAFCEVILVKHSNAQRFPFSFGRWLMLEQLSVLDIRGQTLNVGRPNRLIAHKSCSVPPAKVCAIEACICKWINQSTVLRCIPWASRRGESYALMKKDIDFCERYTRTIKHIVAHARICSAKRAKNQKLFLTD